MLLLLRLLLLLLKLSLAGREQRRLLVVHPLLSLLLTSHVQAMGGHPLLNHLRRSILSRRSLHVAQVLLQRLHLLRIELRSEALRLRRSAWPLWLLLLTRRHGDGGEGKEAGRVDEAATL